MPPSPPKPDNAAPDPPTAVQQNIHCVADLERDFEERRTLVDRLADAIGSFSGSFVFVTIHVTWFILWFLINTGVLAFLHIPKFDPYPFILLAMIVSVEGVLLSTFVLMKQNRMQSKADARAQLDLQINLLAEKEVTKTLQLLRAVAAKFDISEFNADTDLQEMATTTSVDTLAKKINKDLPSKA